MNPNARKFIWYELSTNDTKAAEGFYRKVLGWQAKDSGFGDGYTIFSAGPGNVGGMMAIPENACAAASRPCWAGYIAVDDVDAEVARIRAAGGTVHRAPEDIPNVGRFAVVADPWGAVFMLICGESKEPPPAVPAGTPGHVGWHELHAGDGTGAFTFYSDLFGWKKADAVDMGPMGVYQVFSAGDCPVGGMMTKMPETPAPFWLYYFNVEAVDATMARARENGAQVVIGPHEVPGGSWIAQMIDPQGAMFAVVGTKR